MIRHFQDGDYVHLKIHVNSGSSVTATRCDFRGYERAERQRRVFIGSTSSERSPTEEDPTSIERSRRRSGNHEESEEESAQPPQPPEPESDDDPSLLQLSRPASLPRQLVLSELLPQTSVVTCDFSPVTQARQLLQDLPWILCQPSEIAFPGTCFEAVQPYLVPWNGETPISYHLYTDGSYRKNTPDVGGCGLILIVNTDLGQLCGGVLSRTCLPSSNAHTSETIAMLWATLVAFQLSDAHRMHYPGTPFQLEFGFDADVTGHQSAGHWTSFKHPGLQRLTRNLVYVLQNRHGPDTLQWTHIRAHQGHCAGMRSLTCLPNRLSQGLMPPKALTLSMLFSIKLRSCKPSIGFGPMNLWHGKTLLCHGCLMTISITSGHPLSLTLLISVTLRG